MNLRANRAQLTTLTKELQRRWEQTRLHWQDDRAREFEARYLQSLEAQVNAATAALDKLDRVLAQVRRDCE